MSLNFDPAYTYLLNSLKILDMSAPCHTDHPGTTLHILGAVVILIKYGLDSIFSSTRQLSYEVLSNPESYLRAINLTLIGLISIANFLVGLRVYSIQKRLATALLLQLTPFFFGTLMKVSWWIAPEPLLIVAVLGIIIVLTPGFLRKEFRVSGLAESVALGALIGFGIASKMTFVPFLLLIFLCSNSRTAVYLLASCIFSFVLLTSPIWASYTIMGKWLLSLAIHSGYYGSGPAGLPDISLIQDNFASLFKREPFFLLFLGSMLILLFFSILGIGGRTGLVLKKEHRRMAFVFSALLVIQLLFALKHFRVHYLVPSMSMIGFMGFTIIHFSDIEILPRRSMRIFRAVLAIALISCLGYGLVRVVTLAGRFNKCRGQAEDIQKLIGSSYENPTMIGFQRSSAYPYALFFGDLFCCNHFRETLAEIYSDSVFYILWDKTFLGFGDELPAAEIYARLKNGETMLMQGTNSLEEWGFFDSYPFLELETVYSGTEEYLFEIQLSRSVDHPFGWWPVAEGLGYIEGPYPEWDLPAVRWGLWPRTQLEFDSDGEPLVLEMVCGTNHLQSQEMTVLLNEEQMGRYSFSRPGEFKEMRILLAPQSGRNVLTLEYQAWDETNPKRPLALLFKRLRIVTPGLSDYWERGG